MTSILLVLSSIIRVNGFAKLSIDGLEGYLVIYFLMEIMIQEIKNLFREEYLLVVEKKSSLYAVGGEV